MAIREYVKSGETTQWKTNEVEAYLRSLGFLIGPAGIGTGSDVQDGAGRAIVRVDIDANVPQDALNAALEAFVPSVDPVADAQVELRVAVDALRKTNEGTDTATMLATMKRVILAYATTLGV